MQKVREEDTTAALVNDAHIGFPLLNIEEKLILH